MRSAEEFFRQTQSYLEAIKFTPDEYYEVGIGDDGLVVWSECCACTMTEDTARAVHEALGRWLADRAPAEPDLIAEAHPA